MIQEKYREQALLVKEMLSSEGGYFAESMAPLLGGPRPFHGKLDEINTLIPVRRKEYDAGGIHGIITTVYCLQPIVIDENNWLRVFREESLGINECERIFEGWMFSFYDGIHEGLVSDITPQSALQQYYESNDRV